MPSTNGTCRLGSLIVLLLALPASGSVDGRPIAEMVPADSLVVYMARPYGWFRQTSQPGTAASQAGGGASAIAAIVTLLDASGLIPDEGQVFADIATALPLLGRFEHALVMLDVSSKVLRRPSEPSSSRPPGYSLRLRRLQTAVVLRTDGEHRAVLDQLQRIIGRYTHEDTAELSVATAEGHRYQRLADTRLPGWAIWEWGRLGDFFVVSFGEGAFEKVAQVYAGKVPSLSDDPWFQSATVKARGDRALAQWFIALSRLEERLAHVVKGRHTRVISALEADKMTHDLWTIGLEGRALTWYRCYRRDGKEITHRYSDPAAYLPEHSRLIPEAARHFAVIRVPTRWLVDNLPRAWMAAQSERHIQTWSRVWQRLEEETGLDIDGDLIKHLGENVVIFDYPPHPLRIPFALTIAIEIDDRTAVRAAIDALLGAWGRYLDARAKRKGTTLVRVKVHHTRDGLWYLQAGILGPALKVTDRYVVISWSPQALRDALAYIELPSADGPAEHGDSTARRSGKARAPRDPR